MKIFVLYLLLFVSFSSFSLTLPFPIMSSMGNSGRAGQKAAEYHTLNSANIIQKTQNQASVFYFFNENQNTWGGSVLSGQDIPLAFTWVWDQKQHHRVLSIAGKLTSHVFIGAGVHHFSDTSSLLSDNSWFAPHIGLLYQPMPSLRLAFTGDRIKDQILYGAGASFSIKKIFNIQADISYQDIWKIYGGVEFATKNSFSLRLGAVWPDTSYRLGLSFISYPIKLDYTWIVGGGHSFGLRIHSSSF